MFAAESVSSRELVPCGSPDHEDCGLRLVLDRLGEKWTVMTLAELKASPRRYGEMERSLHGITQRMLTLTLRRLQRDGLVWRAVEATNPPSVTYGLTEQGHSFADLVVNLVAWARTHRDQILSAQDDFDRRHGS